MRRAILLPARLAGLLLAAASVALAAGGTSEVQLQVVKYGDLVDAVRAHRGKVLVVDVWATWCLPCKKEFHNLVELNAGDGGKGLTCMSVSVDAVANKESALKFLKGQKAAFANYLLDEDSSVWKKRWGVETIPAVFVFDAEGRRAGKFTGDNFSYDAVKDLVKRLLAPSP